MTRQTDRLLAICWIVTAFFPFEVAARDWAQPPSQVFVVPLVDQVMALELDPIFPELLLAEDMAKNPRTPGPQRFAVPADVSITPETGGTWEMLGDGGRLWRLRVESPNATDLNFGFTRFRLPEGATLHIVSLDRKYFQGPYGAADNRDHDELWTPVIPGERAAIELYVPPEAAFEPELELGRVGRGYRNWFGKLEAPAKQGSCNIDVVCPEGDDWRNQIQSVAVYSIAGSLACTGSLIMDQRRSFRPFFLSAYHCGVSSANDQTVVTYWNFQSPACGQLGGGTLNQSVSGSTFLARREDDDFQLLELDSPPPSEFNPYWTGWDRRLGTTPQGSVCIHHPNADEKAISFNDDPLDVGSNCILANGTGDTHWYVDNWEQGTTEPGSSGAGLWDPDTGLLVGYLSGGLAACGNPEGYDCFGRFAVGWDGDSANERLKDWLDPDGTGVEVVSGGSTGGGGGSGDFSCGNTGYDDNQPVSAAYFDGGMAGLPDLMYGVRIRLADFGLVPGKVELTGFCASNQLDFTGDGGPWPNEIFVYPDDGGPPDDGVVIAQATIVTGDGTGDAVITLPQPAAIDDDFWLMVRGDPTHDGEDFNVEFDAGPNTGNSYLSTTGIDGLTTDNGPDGYPDGVNYLLRATLVDTSSGAAYTYIVGGVANAPGANDTDWRTKLSLLNRSGATATVDMTYVRATKTASTTIGVSDRVLRSWNNVVPDLFGVNDETTGAVKIESDRPLVVTARTFNQLDEGTLGQYYPGVEAAMTLTQGETGVISQLSKNSSFRTNIGFVNLSDAPCEVRLKLFGDFGAQVGATRTITVPAMGWKQDNDSFTKAGAGTRDDAYAIVEVLTSGCEVWGYGAVVDNTTGDPTTIPIVRE